MKFYCISIGPSRRRIAAGILLAILGAVGSPFCFSQDREEGRGCPGWTANESRLRSVEELRIEYFPVRGDSVSRIKEDLLRYGPMGLDGKKYDAYTRWRIWWAWPQGDGAPDFSRTTVEHSVTVTLPCWKTPPEAPSALIQSWSRFLSALVQHELGHVEIVRTNYARVAPAIHNASKVNPGLTHDLANRIGNEILESIRRSDVAYDTETDNGKRRGVQFP